MPTLSHEDLKAIAATEGPCVTLYFPTQHAESTKAQDVSRLRELIRRAEEEFVKQDIDKTTGEKLLQPVRALSGEEWAAGPGSFVVLSAPGVFRTVHLHAPLPETAWVSPHFHLLPLLPSMAATPGDEFYLLALSQNHVRLLACSDTASQEVELPSGTPTKLDDWLNVNSNAGEGPRGSFNAPADRDKHDQHVANFYSAVNKGLTELLRDETKPLVLAGVEFELSMFAKICSYPHLLPDGVHGAPDSLKGGELHKRALALVETHRLDGAKRALELWEKQGGTDRVSSKADAIGKAAQESRISHLLIAEGTVNEAMNTAAAHTLASGGEVFVVPSEMIPLKGSAVAAIFRY